MALDAGIHAGIRAVNAFDAHASATRRGIAQGAIAVAPPMVSGASAIGHELGQGVIGTARGVGSIASAIAPPLAYGALVVGQGIGHGVGSIASAGHHALGSMAQAAIDHGIPAAQTTLRSLSYQGSDAFHSLLDLINSLPAAPSLEMQEHHTGDTLANPYIPLRNKRRTLSPRGQAYPAAASASASASASSSAPSHTAVHGPEVKSFATTDEWRSYSTGRALLGEQLKMRPQFRTAASGKQAMAKYLRSLTPNDMIQLLLMLDGKD